ncbi:kinesin-like protein Klp59C [Drosophila hydei]|uniref:Kinesin-like protein n=1 Tax=Drosophila hydei TaxID=7224 RepID=A0A6J1L527_DROHY|nr:kinesin-like protein Klp59C [Drosophila hydei]
MDFLSINQQVYIRRSDGRIHQAGIIKLDGSSNKIVTVEWIEGNVTRGKEVPLNTIIKLNPQIYHSSSITRAVKTNTLASIPPRPTHAQANSQGPNGLVVPRQRITICKMPAKAPTITDSTKADVVVEIERLRAKRELRRQLHDETRALRQSFKDADPNNPNWEIARMLRMHRLQMHFQPPESFACTPIKQHQILVCVRKRPLNRRELNSYEVDVISVPNTELLVVHEPRKQVNLTKFLVHHNFRFDYTFDDDCSNAQVYERTARPLVRHIFEGGMATCFAYGQTGSGKTHTMGGEFTGKQQNSRDGIYALAAGDVFQYLHQSKYAHLGLSVSCSFFELYGTRLYDLLMAGKPQLRVLEDGKQKVQVVGLTEKPVDNTDDVLKLLDLGNSVRTSGQTSANSKSSRSHAVFQIVLRVDSTHQLHGKFSLIDLAGNERGADNSSSNRLTRLEGAEINKSLLALKECIRALGRQSTHLPFRGSKLTQVLRDSFIGGKKVRTCMIAMISPSLRSMEHTLNTLRYADRVKELTVHSLVKEGLEPVLDMNLGQSNSLPDIKNQENQLSGFSSNASLPGIDNHANHVHSIWNAYTVGTALEDENLAYFNEATDNYDQHVPSTEAT